MPDESITKYVLSPTQSLRESFFRGSQGSYGTSVSLLFGAGAALLLIGGGALGSFGTAVIFAIGVLIIVLALIGLSAFRTRYHFGWGPPTLILLGYGLGGVLYDRREWWKELARQLRRINEPHEFVLTGLFLIGVMLGVFVVRNWAKEQKAFIESISAILSGTFVAGILAKLFDNQPGMLQKAFSFYALGFATSGALNLIAAAWLTARYTNRRSISSRAVLDFMYGPERTEAIDKYFLRNFENDPDYARQLLTVALSAILERAKREFAARLESARKDKRDLHYYLMTGVKTEEHAINEDDDDKNRKYKFACERLSEQRPITPDMFRGGIALKKGDFLDYIVAPGNYPAAFPRLGSVLGLALEMRETIVMDRDRDTKFRNKDHRDGVSPGEVEQSRGLDEIDYLSYISIPVVSRRGESTENGLGVFNIDTTIFVSSTELGKNEETFEITKSRRALTEMAKDLYEKVDDPNIKYLEGLCEILRPTMELYARCKIGTA